MEKPMSIDPLLTVDGPPLEIKESMNGSVTKNGIWFILILDYGTGMDGRKTPKQLLNPTPKALKTSSRNSKNQKLNWFLP